MTNVDPRNLQDLALLAVQRYDGASGRGLAAQAKREGYVLSHTTANRIISGAYMSKPSAETVEALAHLADVPRRIAYDAAGLAFPHAPLADQLPAGADSLTAGQRRVIIDLTREFVSYNEKVTGMGRELAALREDEDNATQAEDEGRRDPDVQGARDRAPMSAEQQQAELDSRPVKDLMGLAADKGRDPKK